MKEDRRKARDIPISLAVTKEEADTLYRAARDARLSMSEYLRKQLGLGITSQESKKPNKHA